MTTLIERDKRTRAAPPVAVRPWTIALSFGAVATVVCAAGSWIPSLWGDEAATVMSARRPVGSLLSMLFHVDAVHGLYYLGMHGWIRLAGESAFALRLPSAVAIGLAVAAVTVLAGRRGGPTAAVVAGVVGCVLPRLSYAGEEARSFAFTAAAASWLTLLLVWLVDGGGGTAPVRVRRSCWALYGVGVAVFSYLFIYSATIVLAHVVILLAGRASRRTLRIWSVSTGCALLSLAPLALLAFFERRQIGYLGRAPHDAQTLLVAPWFSTPWVAVAGWACILLAAGGGVVAWRRGGRGMSGTTSPAAAMRGTSGSPSLSTTLVGAAWLFVPTGALLVANAVFPVYTARYSTFAAPAAALLVADGLLVLGRLVARRTRLPVFAATSAGLIVFVAVCAPVYLLQRAPYAKSNSDWSEVSAALGRAALPGDAVVFDQSVRPSRQPRLAMRTYPAGFAAVRDVTLSIPYYDNDGWADRAYSVTTAAGKGRFDGVTRVWLIEDDTDGRLHLSGLAGLEKIGFAQTGVRIPTHRTMLIELTR